MDFGSVNDCEPEYFCPGRDETACGWGEYPTGGKNTQGSIQRWQNNFLISAESCSEEFCSDSDKMEDSKRVAVSHAHRISLKVYHEQSQNYTKESVEKLLASPDYQRAHTRCKTCWCVWYDGGYGESCAECGGFSMTRSCPVCRGRCASVWKRNIEMSHSETLAHWDGQCLLPLDEQAAFLQELLMEPATEPGITEAMQDVQIQS